MIGVKFTRDMRPWQAGQTASLPDELGRLVINQGVAEPYRFPAAPHANEAIAQAPKQTPAEPPRRGRPSYQTKG